MNIKTLSTKEKGLILLLILACFFNTTQAEEDKPFAIYLVRHAEKQSLQPADLTTCGKQRAEDLVKILRSIDIDAVYSSDVLRSISTARPIAAQRHLTTELYDRSKLEAFSKQLLQQQRDAVVIGHLNTTPMLASLLSGGSYDIIKGPDYSRIYQIVVVAGKPYVSLLHQSFNCIEPEADR